MHSPKKLGYCMPAEYEPHHGTLMIWPTRPGSWPFQGKAAKKAFSQIIKTIAQGETVYLWWSRTIYLKRDPILEIRSFI